MPRRITHEVVVGVGEDPLALIIEPSIANFAVVVLSYYLLIVHPGPVFITISEPQKIHLIPPSYLSILRCSRDL